LAELELEMDSLNEDDEDDEDMNSDLVYARLVSNLVHVHNLMKRMTRDVGIMDNIDGEERKKS
jgi:hypothetical protein